MIIAGNLVALGPEGPVIIGGGRWPPYCTSRQRRPRPGGTHETNATACPMVVIESYASSDATKLVALRTSCVPAGTSIPMACQTRGPPAPPIYRPSGPEAAAFSPLTLSPLTQSHAEPRTARSSRGEQGSGRCRPTLRVAIRGGTHQFETRSSILESRIFHIAPSRLSIRSHHSL